MPNGDQNSGSFFDKIKDFIPVVAGGAIGALTGGTPGAMVGAGGVAEAVGAEEKEQSARQEKLLQVMSLMEERKQQEQFREENLAERQHQDKAMDDFRNMQATWMHLDRQDANATRQDANEIRLQAANQAHEDRQDANATRQMIGTMVKSNAPPTEDEFNAWLKTQSKDIQAAYSGYAGSAAGRMLAMKNAASWSLLNSPSVRNDTNKRIAAATGMDPDVVAATTAGMDPKRLKSTADSLVAGTLKANTPDKLAKAAKTDAANDAKTRKNLAADLEKQANAYDKLSIFNRTLTNKDRAKYIVDHLADTSWSGLTAPQKAEAQKQLHHYLTGGKDDFDGASRLIFPDDRLSAKASVAPPRESGTAEAATAPISKSGRKLVKDPAAPSGWSYAD